MEPKISIVCTVRTLEGEPYIRLRDETVYDGEECDRYVTITVNGSKVHEDNVPSLELNGVVVIPLPVEHGIAKLGEYVVSVRYKLNELCDMYAESSFTLEKPMDFKPELVVDKTSGVVFTDVSDGYDASVYVMPPNRDEYEEKTTLTPLYNGEYKVWVIYERNLQLEDNVQVRDVCEVKFSKWVYDMDDSFALMTAEIFSSLCNNLSKSERQQFKKKYERVSDLVNEYKSATVGSVRYECMYQLYEELGIPFPDGIFEI